MVEDTHVGLVKLLAQQFGVTEPALNLLLGVILGYPLALVYRKYIYNQDEQKQSFYFILSGLAIGFWSFGYGIFHCLFSIFFTYAIIVLLKASILSVALVFVFTFTYLLVGYYYSSTDSYDITWTTPYCILVLRLIGVAFDAHDGTRPKESLSSDSRKTALKQIPTFLQMMGHCLFPSGCLVGPQFSMKRYLDFLSGKFHSKDSNGKILPPDSLKPSLIRMGLGIFYLATFQVLSFVVSDDLILSDEFAQMCIFKKLLLMGVWGRYSLYKYIACWLLAEAACIMFGLSYNGEKDGKPQWDGVTNINLAVFENSTEFNHYIIAFNVNTNQWVAQHIYKRLKFLGNKYLSQGAVLLFLAVWHGLHSGYYVTFLHEFIVMYAERDFQSFVKSNNALEKFFQLPSVKVVVNILLRLYTFIFMGWSLIPFVFLQYPRYFKGYANCSYSGFFIHYLWAILYGPLLRLIFKKRKQA